MHVENVELLRGIAAGFAKGLTAPRCVALYGDLGAGKTEFARAVIRTLRGPDVIVPSPTFTIVQDYCGISHFDLYRVKSTVELEEIGFFNALALDITLIEWPEIAEQFLPKNAVSVHIKSSSIGREVVMCDKVHDIH
ncbi:MAG: tRNA (adenosine(37)-N6)-threonylcarbamoyltransferase complex ATPase subunit type 1 TsaE [Rickettsiales bacterium]|nr:tRNA (adenosine(37)-N6)-threonylcarbamoyltransferase complex ATPase subunit type 1 TsaE [Rickettsiales bacterium]